MKNRLTRLSAIAAVAALILTACQQQEATDTTEDTFEPTTVSIGECVTAPDEQVEPAASKGENYQNQLKEPDELTIGSDIAFPPFESVDPDTNEPVGFDVDLGKAIAEGLGLEAVFINTGFDALFTQSLPQGQFDVGISAITVKPERQQSVDFTVPYFKADLSLAVRRDGDVREIEDLEGELIGAQAGTTGEDCSRVVLEQVGAADVRTFETALQAFDDLVAGRVAGVINDLPSSEVIVNERPELLISQIIETQEVYGIAIGKQKPDLRVAINEILLTLFEDGTYAEIYEEWFGVTPPPFDLPPADYPN